MRIAIIGWGSLIWDPKEIPLASVIWQTDGPMFPVELARISSNGSLTFVILDGVKSQQTLWNLSTAKNITRARKDLQIREGCPSLEPIHAVERNGRDWGSRLHCESVDAVSTWLQFHGNVQAVVWTALCSNWLRKRGREWSQQDALAYLNDLSGTPLDKARKYIKMAPRQVCTELRRRIESEPGWCCQRSDAKE